MFIDNETSSVILHIPLERILKRKLKAPVGPDQLAGTDYSVYRRTIPDCDYSTHTAIDNGFERIGPNEVKQTWTIRPKTQEELDHDAEMARLKVGI